MEMLNGLIQVISIDFDSNNNSTSVDFKNETNPNDRNEKKSKKNLDDQDLNKLVIELLNSFKKWKLSIEFIESECPLHDYKEIKANGYRSILRINTLAIKRVNKKLSAKEITFKHLTKCLCLARLMTKINNIIKEFHQKDQEIKENLINNNQLNIESNIDNKQIIKSKVFTSENLFSSTISLKFFEFYDSLEQDLADYFRYHPFFHFRKDLRKSAGLLAKVVSTSSNFPSSLIFNNKKRSKVIAKLLNNPTLSFPFSVIDQVDCHLFNDILIPLMFLNNNFSTNTLYLPRQYKFILNDLNTCLNTDNYLSIDNNWSYEQISPKTSKYDKVRIRLIKNKSTAKNKTVLFHCHGGAFVFHSPECHEVYLREFSKKLPEAVIISVAYRTGVEYPKAHQDILDAYLWLVSGLNEVKETIGFQPEKLILCGDSAGAFYSFSLLHILMDFNKEIQKENLLDNTIKCPDLLFFFYGYFNLTTTSAALFNSCLDFFLPPSEMKIAFGSLLFGVEKPKYSKRVFFPWFADKKKRWYNSRELDDVIKEMVDSFEAIPYLSSAHYFDFDSMKIPLCLITSDMDLCLDHNIDLAKRWKGEVTLKILEDSLVHGFLQLELGDKSIKQDIMKSCEFLRAAFDKL